MLAAVAGVVALIAVAFVAGRVGAPGSAAPDPSAGPTPSGAGATAPPSGSVPPSVPVTSVPLASPLGRAVAGADGGDWRRLGTVELDDVSVRVYSRPPDPPARIEVWSSGWAPPAPCRPTQIVEVQLSTPAWVRSLSLTIDGADRFGGRAAVALLAGAEEGDPRWVVVAAVAGPTPVVRFPDGATVRAVAVGPVVVASRPAPASTSDRRLAEGILLGAVPVAEVRTGVEPVGCEPPVVPMPARAAVAVTEPSATASVVRYLVATVLVGASGFEALVAATDAPGDLRGVSVALARQRQLEGLVVAPEDWVFTAEDRLVVRYDVHGRQGASTSWQRFAELVRRDGTWKLTRDSVCEFVLLAGAGCPGWTVDQGPTAQAVARWRAGG